MTKSLIHLPLVAAFSTIILWGFAFPASRAAVDYFSVEEVVLLRHIVACLFYILLFAVGLFKLPKVRDIPLIIVLGLLGITSYQLLFVYGMSEVTGAAAAMIITANPMFASLLARFFLSEKLSKVAWTGILISMGGIAIISLIKGADGTPTGYLALMIAVISIATYFVFQKSLFNRYSPLEVTSYTCMAGTLPLLYFLPQSLSTLTQAPMNPIIWIVAMGVFSSGIGFLLWSYALSKLSTGIVTSFLFLQPICVTIMSWIWLNEVPELKTYLGGIVVLVGLSLVLSEQFKKKR